MASMEPIKLIGVPPSVLTVPFCGADLLEICLKVLMDLDGWKVLWGAPKGRRHMHLSLALAPFQALQGQMSLLQSFPEIQFKVSTIHVGKGGI